MKAIHLVFFFLSTLPVFSQSYAVRDIKSFGAKGDGRTNDHDAFIKAADFFNKRGGNGKLIISKGLYKVGKQLFHQNTKDKPVYEGVDLLHFKNVANLTVEGSEKTEIKFSDGLKFGAFDPASGAAFDHGKNYFVNITYMASVGMGIWLEDCTNVQILNLRLNGNNPAIVLGGVYGDTGIQIPFSGIYITNSRKVRIKKVTSSYFGQDGIMIGNEKKSPNLPDEIVLEDSWFEYNCRQGLSWIGGNDLVATNCHFNHSGKSKHASMPGAGVDVEAEVGPISNGQFNRCEFVNNTGCAFVADSGPSSDCTLNDCTVWGVTNWSIWITKPRFTILNSRIYGSTAHAYTADNEKDATKFINCVFEDKPYKGQEPSGNFLIEENNARYLLFENCLMRSHKKKLVWFDQSANWKPEEKYQLINCKMEYLGDNLDENDWIGLFRNVRLINTTISATHPLAEKKKYWWAGTKVTLEGDKNVISIGKKLINW
ncbi:right-handed parallel beta-helix repeat-containing protein [Flavisolibacter ginsenosidimutans]|uniref:Right handed beta helix domain-containing protein n=1 Tax=Flavisolibacter ginsenosidimutans TaxID=661481 RepID=A0A5B8UNW6_9BACT|nr:right-handed parallel beta-helix repeat-containing protein [Flavisolibacter ginsenosidimutans]QEC58146.1 hypothetical protein FSB75_20295 [Flavisolibacter ginsenosidimutans]